MIWLSLIPLSVKTCLASKDAPILSPDPTRLLTSAIDKVLVATSSNRHKWVFPSRHQSNLSTPWNLETLSSENKNKGQFALSVDGLDLARHCGWMADGIAKLQDFAFEKKFPCSVQAELKLFASPLFQAPRWWDYRCAPTVEDTGSLFSGNSDSSNLVYVALGIGFPYWYKKILASKGDTSSKPQDEKTLILSFFGDRYSM